MQPARRWSSSARSVTVVVLALALAGCGGGRAWRARFVGPIGHGKDAYWLVHAKGKPRAVVVFLHGLSRDPDEQLTKWQAHLASQGYDVIFPRYEQPPPDPNARNNIVGATEHGVEALGDGKLPLVLLGHSRGGRLAVEAAAYLDPRLVIAVFPGLINPQFEPDTNLGLIPETTGIYIWVGDHDHSVGNAGALELARRLVADGFPVTRLHGAVIHSTGNYSATHDSVYKTGPGVQQAVWDRVDRLLAAVLVPGRG